MRAAELRSGRVADAIRHHRLICVLRRVEPRDRLFEMVDELVDAGARIFEITFDAPSAADDVAAVRARLARRHDGDFVIGAGTLLRVDQLNAARRAEADFGVSPLLDVALVREALGSSLPFIPGGVTPTEIATGWAAGATFIKVFPASAVGPTFLRELHGPLPEVELIPTGGIDAANAGDYLAAGAAAVGVGSALSRMDRGARRSLVASLTDAT